MPAGHLPSFSSHFLPPHVKGQGQEQNNEILNMELVKSTTITIPTSTIIELKQDPGLLDLNNNTSGDESGLLLLPPTTTVQVLGWSEEHPQGWEEATEVTPLTNLLADPIFLPFDPDSNKVDWGEPPVDPFHNAATLINEELTNWSISTQEGQVNGSGGSNESLLRSALQPHKELRKVLACPLLSDATLAVTETQSNGNTSSVYYELLVEPAEVIIPTAVEELNSSNSSSQSTTTQHITISTTTHNNQSLSAKWTYTTTNPDGTPKARKRVKKPKLKPSCLDDDDATKVPNTTNTSIKGKTITNGDEAPPTPTDGENDSNSLIRKERSLHYCSICQKGFKDKYSVNVHVRTHTGEKPFACSLCGKSFRQKAHLAKHHQTHAAKAAGLTGKQGRTKCVINTTLPSPSGSSSPSSTST